MNLNGSQAGTISREDQIEIDACCLSQKSDNQNRNSVLTNEVENPKYIKTIILTKFMKQMGNKFLTILSMISTLFIKLFVKNN